MSNARAQRVRDSGKPAVSAWIAPSCCSRGAPVRPTKGQGVWTDTFVMALSVEGRSSGERHAQTSCAGGLQCKGGSCSPGLAIGAACASQSCTYTATCHAGICEAKSPHTWAKAGESCTYTSDCAAGLHCYFDTCSPLAYEGDTCAHSEFCTSTLHCEGGICVRNELTGCP